MNFRNVYWFKKITDSKCSRIQKQFKDFKKCPEIKKCVHEFVKMLKNFKNVCEFESIHDFKKSS